jgi:hypothetical protein
MEHLARLLVDAVDKFSEKTGICVIADPLRHRSSNEVVTLDVPGYRQTNSFSCGFAAGLMVLHTFRPSASIDAFYRKVRPTSERGASTRKVVDALRKSGVGVSVRTDLTFRSIRETIDQGFPIIACVHANEPGVQHWVVIYGYGLKPNRLFVAGNGLPFFDRREHLWADYSKTMAPEKGFGLVCWGK